MNLEDIVHELNKRKQRATYGAVAGVLGVSARGVMAGRPRNPKYSWVVAATKQGRGWPTDYRFDQIHHDCLQQIRAGFDNIIDDSESLKEWLRGDRESVHPATAKTES
jgi:hypothetical protein